MNPQLSKAIFGIGIALSVASIASVYVTMLATQNQNLNSQANPTSQPPNSSTGISTSTIIAIPNGAAVQESSLDKEYYKPGNMKITSNSKVTWTNQDIAAHTATSGQSIDSSDSGQAFDTGTITPGSSGSAVITGSDEIPYHCTFHPWMLGILQITPAASADDDNRNTSIQS